MKILRIKIHLMLAFAAFVLPLEMMAYIPPSDTDFGSPVLHKIRLAGTFGELRSNHFHAGIDIKSSKGYSGDPILSAEEGYISRIAVSPGGYGKAIYITHPNGYKTVYAHLKSFTPEIEAYVKRQQYKRRSYKVNLFPEANELSVDKGERIGIMGMSGHAYGPHLHFEIRESRTEKPLNPLLFGYQIEDTKQPLIKGLKIYVLDQDHKCIHSERVPIGGGYGHYRSVEDTLSVGAWRIGLGVQTDDRMDHIPNKNGVHQIKVLADGKEVYNFTATGFYFSETRYINAHIDYPEWFRHRRFVNRCYKLPGNRLSMYRNLTNDGVLNLYREKIQKIDVYISDFSGNRSELSFMIKRDPRMIRPEKKEEQSIEVPHDIPVQISQPTYELKFSSGTFYEDGNIRLNTLKDSTGKAHSNILSILGEGIPLHKSFNVSILSDSGMNSGLKSKAFIAQKIGKSVYHKGGTWEDNYLKSKSRSFGEFYIALDTLEPKIKMTSFTHNMKNRRSIRFSVRDNFCSSSQLEVNAYVDDRWILLEYDPKKGVYIHRLDGSILSGTHILEIIAEDRNGNRQTLKKDFII